MEPNDQAKLEGAIAARHVDSLADVIAAAMQDAVRAWEVTGHGRLPDDYRRNVVDALTAIYRDATESTGLAMAEDLKCFPWMEQKQAEKDLWDRIVAFFYEAFGARRAEMIIGNTSEQIIKLIAQGQVRGNSRAEIVKSLLENIPRLARVRAQLIVRTETHSASQYASTQVAKTSSIPLDKVWNSTEDYRTRDFGEGDGVIDEWNHRVMDEARVPMDQPFMVPNKYGVKEALMFPGDPVGSSGNIINCRCVTSYKRALSA